MQTPLEGLTDPSRSSPRSAAVRERLLAHAAPTRFGSFEFEFRTGQFDWSDGMYQMANLPIGAPMSQASMVDMVDADDLRGMDAAIRAAVRSKSVSLFDWHLLRADGCVRFVRTWFEVLHGPDDRPERIVGVCRDITDEADERGARIAAERKFHHLLATSTVGMAIVVAEGSLAGSVIDVNDAFVALVGRPRDAIVGRRLSSLPSERIVLAQVEALLAPGFQGEVKVQRAPGAAGRVEPPMRARATAIDGDTGRPEFLVVHLDDAADADVVDKELFHIVDHEDLTGLLDRRRLRAEFAMLTQGDALGEEVGALLLIDIDRFKWINGSRGHGAGDLVLARVAQTIRAFAGGRSVGRLAGNEFVVLLPRTSAAMAHTEAERLRELVSRTVIDDGVSTPHRITVTIGVAVVHAGDGLDRALIDADLALSRGKQRGRNRVEVVSDPDAMRRMAEGVTWAERVRVALDTGSFELWQQPIVDLRTGAVVERELLLRMVGADRERISAERFIGAAEDFGIARDVDAWVLERVALLASCRRRVEPGVRLAINLSAHSIADPTLAARIDANLARHGIAPERITFELTESAAIADLDAAGRLCHELRERGCRISIDDFGVGYGSFTYLQRLPFDDVKIDRSLSADVAVDRRSRLSIEATVLIARGLGSVTIAEGIECAETASLLVELGVDCGQGYYFGRPERF